MICDTMPEEGRVAASLTAPLPTAAGAAGGARDMVGEPAAQEDKPHDACATSAGSSYSDGGAAKSELPTQSMHMTTDDIKTEEARDTPEKPGKPDKPDTPKTTAPLCVAVQRPESQQRGDAIDRSAFDAIERGPGMPLDFWTEDENARFVLALRADRYPPDWYELAGMVGRGGGEGTDR